MKLTSQTKSGIPLLTAGIGEPPRLNVGWPIPLDKLDIPGPERKARHGMPSARKRREPSSLPKLGPRPLYTNPAYVRSKAHWIATQDSADKLSKDKYLILLRDLIGNYTKYQLFSSMYPNNTFPLALQVNEYALKPANEADQVDNGHGRWYEVDNGYGARVQVIGADEKTFFDTLAAKLELPPEEPGLSPRSKSAITGVGINLEYNGHPNVLWVTSEKEVWRYEPQYPATALGQREIDSALYGFFQIYLPSFKYNCHRLKASQCVATVRGKDRIHTSDFLCRDYTLLYLERRIKGMSHEGAALDLVNKSDDILKELEDLLYTLGMEYREISAAPP